MKVKLTGVRLAFSHIFQAQAFEDGDPKFSANFIIEPGSENAKIIKKAIKAVCDDEKFQWNTKKVKTKQGEVTIREWLESQDRICYRESDKTNQAGEVFEGFEGNYWISATNASRPTILDRDKTPLTEEDGRPYSGCYVVAILDVWAQDHKKYGKRINATLKGIQYHSEGDGFGGGAPASASDFDDLGTGEDDGDLV